MLDNRRSPVPIAERNFTPELGAVPAARHLATDTAHRWAEPTRQMVGLLTSELCSNAVVHARTPFTVRVEDTGSAVRVDVTDHGAGHPRVIEPDPANTGGWGLWMVNAVASRWGVTYEGRTTTVWFELDPGTTES